MPLTPEMIKKEDESPGVDKPSGASDLATSGKTEHTPGPWKFGEYWDERGRKHAGRRGLLYAVHANRDFGSRGLVVNVGIKGPEVEDSWLYVSDANARLIAAAPDLLATCWGLAVSALQSERYAKDRRFRDYVDAAMDACRIARGEPTLADHEAAALAKAEGRS